jgi:hypothetical protein
MTLIGFHRLLISAAILFCGGFALREFSVFSETGGTLTLVLGITFGVLSVGLGYYLANLQRFLDGRANR